MQIPKPDDLASLINTCFHGVDKSTLGPIMQYVGNDPVADKHYNKVAFQVFLSVTLAVIAKADFGPEVKK